MAHVSLPSTTRTLELSQLAELNTRLGERRPGVTASQVGLEGARTPGDRSGRGLPGSAVLVRLCWDGPPEYPYIHGHFVAGDQRASRIVDLHTAALRELSRCLGVRQQWGA